jgi:hypothetical protein
MIKTLKTFAMAMLLTGATVTAVRAQVTLTPPYAVETVTVQLTALYTYQGEAKTNDRSGTITDVKDMETISTPKFLQLLATNIGLTNLSKSATLIIVTELAQATNFTDVITNSTTNIPGTTFLVTNIDPTNFVYVNLTNSGIFVTNGSPIVPNGYSPYTVSGAVTNLVQATGQAVIVGTNIQFLINNGPGLDPANFVSLASSTNDNAGPSGSVGDAATRFLNTYVSIDNISNFFEEDYFVGQGFLTNFFMAQDMTNHGHIFAGTIKTNLDITGTLYGDTISIVMGPPRDPVVGPAPAVFNFAGTANATAVDANVGTGKSALPFASWNATFPVTGGGTVGGTITNTVELNRSSVTYVSNGVYLSFPYNDLFDYYSTNPPIPYILTGPFYFSGTNTVGYTNLSTNYYTNYQVLSPTNQSFILTGTVVKSFKTIVQQ